MSDFSSKQHVVIDLGKFEPELNRMMRGEIGLDVDYLAELVEVKDVHGRDLHMPVVPIVIEVEVVDEDEDGLVEWRPLRPEDLDGLDSMGDDS